MHKLTAQDNSQNKQFKPKIYHSKGRGQTRNLYETHSYDQRNYQNRYRSNSGDQIQVIEDKTTEMDIEEIIEMIIMKEVGVGLEKDNLQITSEGMTEVIVVGLDQIQELVLIDIGLDVINVESTIILQKTV